MTLDQILDSPDKKAGFFALLVENAWPDDDASNAWEDGRHLAMQASAGATWCQWLRDSSGRVPSAAEVAYLFSIPQDQVDALLEAARPHMRPLDDAELCNMVSTWYGYHENATVGMAATALEMPLERLAQAVPPIHHPDAMWFFREELERPLAEQIFGADGL